MRQEREQKQSIRASFNESFQRWFERVELPGSIPPVLPKELFPFGGEEEPIKQARFNIGQEERSDKSEDMERKEVFQETDVQRSHDFEPFVGKEPQDGQENNLFVNLYGGNYAQKMELNRKGVERTLTIAHLEGRVILGSLSPSRSTAEAQGNELAARRFLVFDNKRQRAEEENPYKRVVSVPEGWRIEVNDQRLTEELMEKRLVGKELQKAFVRRFNRLVKQGIRESVWREKCSSEKDSYFRKKLASSVALSAVGTVAVPFALNENPLYIINFVWIAMSCFCGYNVGRSDVNNRSEGNKFSVDRHIDNLFEYLMPPVEIDKVGRTFAYLSGKGRTLVR